MVLIDGLGYLPFGERAVIEDGVFEVLQVLRTVYQFFEVEAFQFAGRKQVGGGRISSPEGVLV